METKELIQALRSDAEWAYANEWETPITLGDHLDAAADALEALLAEAERQAAEIAAVTAERDALKEALELMAEYIVNLGGVDYHLCDVIPQEHHLKYQPKNDGNYDNEPWIECVKAYFMSEAGKEKNDG